jgi:hypothetical protein
VLTVLIILSRQYLLRVRAGLKVAQYIGGPPSTEISAGLGTMAVVQGTTAIMSKVLSNQSCSQDFVKKSLTASASNNTGR